MKVLNVVMFFLLSFSVFASGSQEKMKSLQIDKSASNFKWTGSKPTGKHFGSIQLKSADAKFDKKGNIKGGTFVADMTSITVEDLSGDSKGQLEGHLKSPDFFNVEKFPTATLKVKNVSNDQVSGQLTILGKTNSVEFPVKKEGKKYKGTLVFDRTKWGINYKSKNIFKNLADKFIYDDIKLEFTLAAKAN